MLIIVFLALTFLTIGKPSLATSLKLQQEQKIQDQAELQEARTLYFQSKAASSAAQRTEQARQRQEEMLIKGRAYTRRSSQVLENHLNRWRNRIENMVGLSEETRIKVLGQIDEVIAKIKNQEGLIDTAEEIDQLKEIGQEIRDYWQEEKITINKVVGLSLVEKANTMLDWATKIYQKLKSAVETAEQSGDTISLSETSLSNMQELINQTEEKINQAEKVFSGLDSVDGFVSGRKFISEAHRLLISFKIEATSLWQKVKN